MKRLSDYKEEEAIELWGDLIDPLSTILMDPDIRSAVESGKSKMNIAGIILKKHKREALDILLRIDPEPIDGLSIIIRLANLLVEIGEREEIKAFFGYAEQETTLPVSGGSVMENTGAEEN